MRYFSLFSGIGGFEVGIKNAYVEITNRAKNGGGAANQKGIAQKGRGLLATKGKASEAQRRWNGELFDRKADPREPHCVGFSEIDRHAVAVYQKHFPNHQNYEDITKIDAHGLPDFDLLVGGFPCQSFSIAGKRRGFEDTRGTLFFDIARIIRAKQPAHILLENVKGLLNHEGGKTFGTILDALDEVGYDVQWQVLNSKNFGVPQNRERVFIVGHLRGEPRPEVFPLEGQGNENSTVEKSAKAAVARTLTGGGHSGGNHSGMTILRVPEATKKGYAEAKIGDSINLSVPNSKTRRGRVGVGVAQTLDTGMQQHTLTPDMRIRRLTPKECERLQGFPDDWTKGVSDTQRYKMCGNAVTTNVIQAIMEKLL